MAKKRTEKEQDELDRRIEKAESAASRQAMAALAASKFVKDAVGYHCRDIEEARRWIKAAQGHFTELLDIFNLIEEEMNK